MATFEEHIEAITRHTITSTSIPVNQTQLSQFLVDAVIDCVNKITQINPKEISKFTSTTNHTSTVAKTGKVLSVMREHDSTSILRMCTPLPPQLRYEATDVNSLHYRSKYNPGYYELDGNIYTVPAAGGSDNDIVVTQVAYDTGLVYSDNYNEGAVANFPLEYEYLIALHASSMVMRTLAVNIHANLPTKPTEPDIPIFSTEVDSLPELPAYLPPELNVNYSKVMTALNSQDLDLADKNLNLIDKKLEEWNKNSETEVNHFQKELEIFKSKLEKSIKDYDRKSQIEAGEYRSRVMKYQYDIADYQAELSEKIAQYKWYMEESMRLMVQYNEGIFKIPMSQPKKQRQSGRKRQQPQEQQQQQEGY